MWILELAKQSVLPKVFGVEVIKPSGIYFTSRNRAFQKNKFASFLK